MRVRLTPTPSGLQSLSDVMVDKVLPMPRAKIAQVDAALAFALGLSPHPPKKRVKRRT
jgi:hypothetical protein